MLPGAAKSSKAVGYVDALHGLDALDVVRTVVTAGAIRAAPEVLDSDARCR
jgi:hypothetical protein